MPPADLTAQGGPVQVRFPTPAPRVADPFAGGAAVAPVSGGKPMAAAGVVGGYAMPQVSDISDVARVYEVELNKCGNITLFRLHPCDFPEPKQSCVRRFPLRRRSSQR